MTFKQVGPAVSADMIAHRFQEWFGSLANISGVTLALDGSFNISSDGAVSEDVFRYACTLTVAKILQGYEDAKTREWLERLES